MISLIESALCGTPFVYGILVGSTASTVLFILLVLWYCHTDRSGVPRRGDLWVIKYGSGSTYVKIRQASNNAVIYSIGESEYDFHADTAYDWKERNPMLVRRRRFWLF